MKTIVINGVHYNPRHVLSIELDKNYALLKFIDGTRFKLNMESIEEANNFKNDLMNSW